MNSRNWIGGEWMTPNGGEPVAAALLASGIRILRSHEESAGIIDARCRLVKLWQEASEARV